ncbi:EF-hand domain-containing protein [Pleurotus pulmonarius]
MTTEKQRDGLSLLDGEGDLTDQCEKCLKHIFAKYCTPSPENLSTRSEGDLLVPPENAYLTDAGLDRWASETNGAPFSEDQKEELQMLDVTDDGHLTYAGFIQLYQLQTENDEAETWKDLIVHGFNRRLEKIA